MEIESFLRQFLERGLTGDALKVLDLVCAVCRSPELLGDRYPSEAARQVSGLERR